VSAARVLLIEDDTGIRDTLRRVLEGEGYEVETEKRGDQGLSRAAAVRFNVVITDLRLPGLGGLELVRELRSAQPRLPIILITAFGTTETAIEAMKSGAFDYVLKPFEIPEMLALVGRALESNRAISEPVGLERPGTAKPALIGKSAAMQNIYKEIGRVSMKPVNVLIRGETGTGKELIARALHQHSDRASAAFVAINCAAIPETLLESELFGHERGAFTGATERRVGRFEQAQGGTIFLDEIGDMTMGTQVKLMRVLQEKCFQRLGGKEDMVTDARVLAATNCDLEAAIKQQRFREDLYYRLSVVVINLPPLRKRTEDIPELVQYFLERYGPELGNPNPSIQPKAVEFLQGQLWPGNVRQLENVIRKALLVAQRYTVTAAHAEAALSRTGEPAGAEPGFGEFVGGLLTAARKGEIVDVHARVVEAAEREVFARAIEAANGNQARAARWLGISRITMKAKLVQFGLHPRQELHDSVEPAEPQAG
jgi:nitrogen regulation protein NR(I)